MKYSNQSHRSPARRALRGFTLVETIIAMGIITIMITAFLAAFGPAVQGIRKSTSAKEASRLSTTLEVELSILRAGDDTTDYSTSFEKAYEWIKGSSGTVKNDIVLLYQYRGDPGSARADGTLNPQTDKSKQVPGEDYVLQSVMRRLGDTDKVSQELQPGIVQGRVFYVRMNQLIFKNGELVITDDANKGKIVNPTEPHDEASTHDDYLEAVITFQAEFYVLRNSIYDYVVNGFDPDNAGKPVFTRNMAVRR